MRLASTLPARPAAIKTCRFSSPVSVRPVVAKLRADRVVISLNMRMSGHLSDGQGYRLGPTLLAKLAVGEFCSLADPQNDPTFEIWKSERIDSVTPIDSSDDGKERRESANLEFLTLA